MAVKKFLKVHDKPKYSNEANLVAIEEIILEADKNVRNNYTKMIIKRRSNDGFYYCQLELRSEDKGDIVFQLGNYIDAKKYKKQKLNFKF